MTTIDLTSESFDQTMASDEIVLLDSWASSCGPCRPFALPAVAVDRLIRQARELDVSQINQQEEAR